MHIDKEQLIKVLKYSHKNVVLDEIILENWFDKDGVLRLNPNAY